LNGRHTRPRWQGAGQVAATLLIATASATACGGSPASPAVAALGTSPASPTSSSTGQTSALAYSQCMRAHGISDFPDPDSSGSISLNASAGSDLSPGNSAFQAANNACKSLKPAVQQQRRQEVATAALNYAKCMRQHGISDFPDPRPDGTMQVRGAPGSDLDAANPQFQRANSACKRFLQSVGKGAGATGNSGGKGSGGKGGGA
jgi:hypothetical protein